MPFDGNTYNRDKDQHRLTGQYLKVFNLMKDARWRTLRTVADLIDAPEASVSARLRDFRKEKFGSHIVERDRNDQGLFFYRLIVRTPEPVQTEMELRTSPAIE
tara:strand:- start:126 stop:434 length:309 start_codon:yes stop_codon:yes gene_type:complete